MAWSKIATSATGAGSSQKKPRPHRKSGVMSSAVAVPQHPNTKPLSKKGQSLLHYEPDQELLALRNSLLTSRAMKKMPIRSATKTTCTSSISPSSFLKSVAASSSSACSVETLPISASSMSDDEASFMATTANEQQQQYEVTTGKNKKKKKKSFKTWLKESLGRLLDEDDITSATLATSTMAEKKNLYLPDTGFYSNNHVMVNRERALANISPLHRSRYLDAMALSHALDLAENNGNGDGHDKLVHSVETLPELRRLLSGRGGGDHSLRREVGENVQRGASIRAMHAAAMQESSRTSSDGSKRRRNILREAYTEFGMATALGKKDGQLYMVQLFRGPPATTASAATTVTTLAHAPQQDAATRRRPTATTTLTAFLQKEDTSHHEDDETIDF